MHSHLVRWSMWVRVRVANRKLSSLWPLHSQLQLPYQDTPIMVKQARRSSANFLPQEFSANVGVFVGKNTSQNRVNLRLNSLLCEVVNYFRGLIKFSCNDPIEYPQNLVFTMDDYWVVLNVFVFFEIAHWRTKYWSVRSVCVKLAIVNFTRIITSSSSSMHIITL